MSIDLKKAQPFAVGGLLVLAIGLAGNAMWAANSLENLVLGNVKDIFYEKEARVVGAAVLKKSIEDLNEDIKDLDDDFKQETKEIKNLLNQLLLQRPVTPVQ